jgi:hypothetical protein
MFVRNDNLESLSRAVAAMFLAEIGMTLVLAWAVKGAVAFLPIGAALLIAGVFLILPAAGRVRGIAFFTVGILLGMYICIANAISDETFIILSLGIASAAAAIALRAAFKRRKQPLPAE